MEIFHPPVTHKQGCHKLMCKSVSGFVALKQVGLRLITAVINSDGILLVLRYSYKNERVGGFYEFSTGTCHFFYSMNTFIGLCFKIIPIV